ncbi:MAG TPA: hypothetical protein VMZ32_13860 [Gammaproteobacteria bacterium]|nr:hypothetical protein [Gammaproteobacteria bacterium]
MNIFQPTLLLILILLLGGCAKPLQPDNYAERISSTWLDANRFIVAYPRKSTDQQVVDLALLHSAEIALQNGFNYFIVVNTDDSVARSTGALPAATTEFIVYNGIRYQHASPASSNTILCFERKPQGFSYVALFVKASLRAKYGLDQQAAPI